MTDSKYLWLLNILSLTPLTSVLKFWTLSVRTVSSACDCANISLPSLNPLSNAKLRGQGSPAEVD